MTVVESVVWSTTISLVIAGLINVWVWWRNRKGKDDE